MKVLQFRRRGAAALAALAIALPLASAAPSSATVDPSAPVWYEVDVISVTKTSNVIRYDQELGRCGGAQTAVTCKVSASKTATRTIGTAFGFSAAGVAAKLGISSSKSVTITATCSAKIQPPKYPWLVGYAEGTVYRYQVRQRTYEYGRLVQTLTSEKTAFNPLGIHCGLSSI